LQGDVARESDVRRALAELRANLPRLRGVFHCAGVLDDGALVNQTYERFTQVLAPKVEGAWHLHELTRDCDLDSFVLFSSMVSVLGSAGQSNHAAANAFLDALAAFRRAEGLPGLSINWGAWSRIGAAATAGLTGRLRQAGIGTINPETGLIVLEQLLRTAPVQVGVLPVDWGRFQAQARDQFSPLLDDLLGSRSQPSLAATSPPVGDLLRRLDRTMPEERQQALRRHLAAELARVLGLDPSQPLDPQRGFFDLGMDSLMAVELRNRLQSQVGSACVLTSTVIFDHPTLARLADHIGQVLFRDGAGVDNADHSEKPADDVRLAEWLDRLSEEEFAQAMDAKLSKYAKGQ
jgi:acyl carrier protein